MDSIRTCLINEIEPPVFRRMDEITAAIYSGVYSVFVLPNDLYSYYYTNTMGAVGLGFGLPSTFLPESIKWKSALKYKLNVEFFSGAKTFQQVKDIGDFVFTSEGTKRPWKEFREFAIAINNNYNIQWLKTEQNAAFSVAQSAEQWHAIQEEKEIFPLLQYQTVGDSRVRPEHAAWDGIIRPVDDDFWKTRMPPNDFGCRCRVIQLTDGKITSLRGIKDNDSKVFQIMQGKAVLYFQRQVIHILISRILLKMLQKRILDL